MSIRLSTLSLYIFILTIIYFNVNVYFRYNILKVGPNTKSQNFMWVLIKVFN